jgi:hypothetical protein
MAAPTAPDRRKMMPKFLWTAEKHQRVAQALYKAAQDKPYGSALGAAIESKSG